MIVVAFSQRIILFKPYAILMHPSKVEESWNILQLILLNFQGRFLGNISIMDEILTVYKKGW